MDLETNDTNPDFKCPECGLGLDLFTEFEGDSTWDCECTECKHKFIVRRECYYEYKVE